MKSLKHIFFFILVSFGGIVNAQNLIPNPGFEEHSFDTVFDWEQTEKPYYHFENNSTKAHTGDCFNGICIWKTETSEYLQVKLNSPLEKNKKYDFSCYTKIEAISGFVDTIKQLGVYFSNEKFSVSSKKMLFFKPDIKLDVFQKELWNKCQSYYIAKGGEEYLLLGHFYDNAFIANSKTDSITQIILLEIEKMDVERNDEIDAGIAVIEEKYKQVVSDSWNIDKVKSEKKKKKLINEFKISQKKKQTEIQAKKSEINKIYAEKYNMLYEKYNIEPNHINSNSRFRLYFDDFSLTPVKDSDIAEIKIIPLKNVFFNTGKFDLLPASFAELDVQVDFLNANPELKIEVSGHTDNIGTEASNQLLSQNRAKAVADYLIQRGISSTRISYKGYGSTKPITTNDTEDGRAKNRRVELKVLQD